MWPGQLDVRVSIMLFCMFLFLSSRVTCIHGDMFSFCAAKRYVSLFGYDDKQPYETRD